MRCLRGLLALALLLLPGRALADAVPPAEDFNRSVAVILVRRCVACHNPSEARGGLDLTRRAGPLKGGKTGPAVVPGKPDESYLIDRVAAGTMPPKKAGGRLPAEEVAALTRWVKGGAKWPDGRVLSAFEFTTDQRAGYDWWSLQPVARPVVPPVRRPEWLRNPIDAFVLVKLEAHGLAPAPPADRATLVRRVTFDLIGLPPTPEEIDAALGDPSPDWYEKVVDRLLASPHYGERWGRHWLDVARYGESDGFENDRLRDHAWRYRDYVISAFNADKPYDRFVKEQLAGDMLEPVTREGIAATGFLVAGPWDEIQNVAKSKLEKQRAHAEQMEDMLAAVGQAFLGLTVHCARCHDHKFDPIPQTDYYRLKAVFDGVDHGNRPLLTPDEQKEHDRAVAALKGRIAEWKAELAKLGDGESGDAAVTPAGPKALAEGRFGKALDARQAHAEARGKVAYQQPPLTVECWAKLHGKAGFNILVANNVKESGDHWEVYTYAGSGEFSAYLPGFAPAEIRSGACITDGKWHHVAMTFDGSRARLFVDARLVKDQAVKRQRAGGAPGQLWIGAYPPQRIGCDGLVDEVRISRLAGH